MSQHYFRAANGSLVQAGFDRQMRDFFFNLFAKEKDFPHKPSETSLDGTVNTRDLDSIRARVSELVPSVPDAVWESISEDAAANVGNRVVHWNLNGTISQEVNPAGTVATAG